MDQELHNIGPQDGHYIHSFAEYHQDREPSIVQHVRFTEDIPIDPGLLRQSGYEPQPIDEAAADSLTESNEEASDQGTDSSVENVQERSAEDGAAIPQPNIVDAGSRQEASRGRGRGRPRGRPRGRGRGSGYAGRAARNPLHVRELPAPRGSKPRGSKKGVKKGPRRALEPSDEFKALKSQATLEYINGDFEEALATVEQAISLNPEIFSAYALLSSIYQALGDDSKAVAVLFQGAHTTPRNTNTWKSVAQSILAFAKDRSAALPDAVYCYNRVISTDRDDVDARMDRARINIELGRYNKAIHDWKHLLRLFPHDISTLRSLSECCSLNGTPLEAISYYDQTIEYYRTQDGEQGPDDLWSDVNIYADLYWMSKKCEEGLKKIKQVIRWMLGRGSQSYWDDYYEDDREFDADDSRRLDVMQYDQGQFDVRTYGLGLPMELRIKLGLLRLKLSEEFYGEALRHFKWLDPSVNGQNNSVHEYADLIRDVANAFKEESYFEQAYFYFSQLRNNLDPIDARLCIDLGQCCRHLEKYSEAEKCFLDAANTDEDDLEGLEELVQLFIYLGDLKQVTNFRSELASRRRKKILRQRYESTQATANGEDPDVPVVSIEDIEELEPLFNARMLTHTQKKPAEPARPGEASSAAKSKFKDFDMNLQNMIPIFQEMNDIEPRFRSGDQTLQLNWMNLAKQALQHLQSYKPFWPTDRPRPFTGYAKSVREKVLLPEYPRAENDTETSARNKPSDRVPDSYCGVHFSDWLACLLRYVLRLATGCGGMSESDEALTICRAISGCSIWYTDKEAQFSIHLVWSMCAVQNNDHETICEVSRFFMKQHQFVTDSYRLYAILNRFSNHGNEWYNMSPSQKYMLRQIKTMDLCLMRDGGNISSIYDERAHLSNKDENGNFVVAKVPDVALLVLYGHMLFATTSYAYGLHYLYRAHDEEPSNPMILLSLALGYTHYATKRQAENRHALISCGLSFLFKYYDERKTSLNPLHRQEAEYNVGRTYHFIGLLHLAIPFYEKCLELSDEVQRLPEDERAQDFAREAAYALRGFHAQAGQLDSARNITQRWLSL